MSNEIMKMIVLRPPQLDRKSPVVGSVLWPTIFNLLTPSQISTLEASSPLLYLAIHDISNPSLGSTRETFEDKAELFKKSAYYQGSLSALQTYAAAFYKAQAYLDTISPATTVTAVIKALTAAFGSDPGDYVANNLEKHVRLWDNLFCRYILPEDGAMREDLMMILRLLYLAEHIGAPGYAGSPYNDYQAFKKARVEVNFLIPNPKGYGTDPLPASPLPGNSDQEQALKNIEACVGVINELRLLIEEQNRDFAVLVRDSQDSIKGGTMPPGIKGYDPTRLTAASVAKLSSEASGFMTAMKIDPAKTAVETIFAWLNEANSRMTTVAYRDVKNPTVVFVNGMAVDRDSLCAQIAEVSTCYNYQAPTLPMGKGRPLMLGFGDLKVVKSKLHKYELGEVAHIDNVLAGQYKDRMFRDLRRTEESITTDEENESEKVTENQTTERFELQKEVSNVVQSSSDFSIGVDVTASFGSMLSISSGLNYASNNSQTTSQSVAQSYAKEVVSKALNRVISKVRTQRSFTRTTETEETSTNKLDNRESGANLTGVFRWVNKIYKHKIVNYGKRLMFEFVVPEPAAFYIYQKLRKISQDREVKIPVEPTKGTKGLSPIMSYSDITPENYGIWAALYDVKDTTAPPVEFKTVSRAVDYVRKEDDQMFTMSINDMEVPEGYICTNAMFSCNGDGRPNGWIHVWVGGSWMDSVNGFYNASMNHTDRVPVSILSSNTSFHITIEAMCRLRPETMRAWKVKTYQSIMAGYNQAKKDYDEAMARNVSADYTVIQGQNPMLNREIEREELKKHAISMVTRQRFATFDAMTGSDPTAALTRYPEFSFEESEREGRYIQFFEQAFDWKNLMYAFYPYFWGRKFKWLELKSYKDTDPLFEKFLKAGAARIVVAASEGYEKAVMHYLATGEIWQGGDVPAPTDPLYRNVYSELEKGPDPDSSEPWLTTVPTELVYLQADASLPDNSTLPDEW